MKKTSKLQKLINECVALAIKICILKHPKCELCPELAITAHHIVHQASSNYLRCDQKNLIAICGKCHCKIHIGNSEGVINIQITKMRGLEWADYILKGKQKTIKSDIIYWTKKKAELSQELAELEAGDN
jgi:hypothetical protein